MKKIICLLLVCLMIIPFVASCNQSGPNGGGANGGDKSDDSSKLDIPETADFGGETINILSAGNVAYDDFSFDEGSSLALDNAQYERKTLVEENYVVDIAFEAEQSYSSGNGPGFQKISQAVAAGDCNYDIGLIAGYDVSVLAYNDYLYDLKSVPNLDLTKDWWSQEANKDLSINDTMFFTTGEITVSDNDATFVLIFNKELRKNYELEDPYSLVKDNKWTFDKFAQLCKSVTGDLNDDSVMNENDRFGLLVWDDSVLAMINAAGQKCCTIADDGTINLSIYNETTASALEKYFAIVYDTQYALCYQRLIKSANDMWQKDQGLFWTTWMGAIPRFRAMDSDFGILPYPKLTETQDRYYSTVAPYNSQFVCVPLIQNDVDRTGIILEALAYGGMNRVTDAYYEVNLVGQYVRDEDSVEMLDIIFDSLNFDIGYYYQVGPYNKQFIYMIREYNTNFASMYEKFKNAAQASLDTINKYYESTTEQWQKTPQSDGATAE